MVLHSRPKFLSQRLSILGIGISKGHKSPEWCKNGQHVVSGMSEDLALGLLKLLTLLCGKPAPPLRPFPLPLSRTAMSITVRRCACRLIAYRFSRTSCHNDTFILETA